jgi:alkanesulfonate monooxygenase SsuD/methylene tetrahydromethanopterin reductase-like flavin-dependent oxidoreductase (luciferase family)
VNAEEETIILRGKARLDPLTSRERVAMFVELNLALLRHGRTPDAYTCLHVIGDVTEEEWLAAVARMRNSA